MINPAIMLYRICCLYKHSKKVTIWMSIVFALEIISMVVIDALYLRDLSRNSFQETSHIDYLSSFYPAHGGFHGGSHPSPCPSSSDPLPAPPSSGPPLPGGPPGPPPSGPPPSQRMIPKCLAFSPSWYFISWTPIFVFELVILLMGLRAGVSYFKETRSLPSSDKFPLHSILLRDSILFPMM